MANAETDPANSEIAHLNDVPSNPIPDGARVGYIRTIDGVRLRFAVWEPVSGQPKGTVCLLQGRTEFIEKYFETIQDFRRRGFVVATFDWRGQGGSERLISDPLLGHVDSFNEYWLDLKSFHADVLLPDCRPPFYMVAHSMGGLIGLDALTRDRMMFDRAMLCAPMIGVPDASLAGVPLSPGAVIFLGSMMKFFGLGRMPQGRKSDLPPSAEGFPGNGITSDFNRYMRAVDIITADESLKLGSPTYSWVTAAFRAMEKVKSDKFPQKINVPVLIVAAALDEIVSTPTIEFLASQLRTGYHTIIANARHEMWMENEKIRNQMLAAFDAFIGGAGSED